MTIIDGIDVAVYECDKCGSQYMWIFKGMSGEGYKISCSKCGKDQRTLIDEMNVNYLWKHKEASNNAHPYCHHNDNILKGIQKF